MQKCVPVVDSDQNPLMPTAWRRAMKWIKSGKATPFWKRGVFCVRLNQEPSGRVLQDITIGIDPGSKKEGITVKSASHTFLNIQMDTVTWVKEAKETQRNLRRSRRYRKTPCRRNKQNRSRGGIPPSTKARWGWKLRICFWLQKMFPISSFVVEDLKAQTKKGKKRWNISFSPLEIGKQWFYKELEEKIAPVILKEGWETKELRDSLGLKKTSRKLSETFDAHCVDSWVLSWSQVGGSKIPNNTDILFITPIRFHRRQLHLQNPSKGGIRKRYGGTMSWGFKRGSLVRHPRVGLSYVGGFQKDRISLHNLKDGKRFGQNFYPSDCQFLSYNSWRVH